MKDARLRGIYEYTVLLKMPKVKGVHIPYRLLAKLVSVAPENSVEEFVVRRLASYGMVSESSDDLSRRISWADKWAKREGERTVEPPTLSPGAKKAIEEFAKVLGSKNADEIQNAAFEAAKNNGLKPGEFFPVIYSILLGSDRGPRLGPYVIDAGQKDIRKTLLEAVIR